MCSQCDQFKPSSMGATIRNSNAILKLAYLAQSDGLLRLAGPENNHAVRLECTACRRVFVLRQVGPPWSVEWRVEA